MISFFTDKKKSPKTKILLQFSMFNDEKQSSDSLTSFDLNSHVEIVGSMKRAAKLNALHAHMNDEFLAYSVLQNGMRMNSGFLMVLTPVFNDI